MLVVRSIASCLSNSVSIANYYLSCFSDFHITESGTNVYDYVIMKYFFYFRKTEFSRATRSNTFIFSQLTQIKMKHINLGYYFFFSYLRPQNLNIYMYNHVKTVRVLINNSNYENKTYIHFRISHHDGFMLKSGTDRF